MDLEAAASIEVDEPPVLAAVACVAAELRAQEGDHDGCYRTVDEALVRLAAHDAALAQVVECRFFAGLSETETAEAMGTSVRTVQRLWRRAKAWLYQELTE